MSAEVFLTWAVVFVVCLIIGGAVARIIERLREIEHGIDSLRARGIEIKYHLDRVLARDYEACIDHIYTVLTVAHDEEGKMLVDALRTRKPIKKRRKKNVG